MTDDEAMEKARQYHREITALLSNDEMKRLKQLFLGVWRDGREVGRIEGLPKGKITQGVSAQGGRAWTIT